METEKGEEKSKIEDVTKKLNRRDLLKFAGITAGFLTASVPLATFILAEKTETNEKLDKAIVKIKELLNQSYAKNKPGDLKNAIKNATDVLGKIIKVLEDEGLKVPEGGELYERIDNYFKENGYILSVAPMPIGNEMYIVNSPFHKTGKAREFDMANLKIEGFPKSENKIIITEVVETLTPDIRETNYSQENRMTFDGMTVADINTGKSFVLIFPDKIKENASKQGLDLSKYQKTVELNEVAQVYFSEIIPNEVLGMSLDSVGVDTKGHNWKFYHLQEAFSDLVSMKYGEAFDFELDRILESDIDAYDFSKNIAIASVNLALEKTGSILRVPKDRLKDVIKKIDEAQYKILKDTVIRSYEVNIGAIFFALQKLINK